MSTALTLMGGNGTPELNSSPSTKSEILVRGSVLQQQERYEYDRNSKFHPSAFILAFSTLQSFREP
jgi:hypothetical protein